jgi:type IX secretion system PorP/SprF family membrane protein
MNVISDNLGPKEVFNISPYFGIKKKVNNSYISFSISPSFKSTTLNFGSLVFVNPDDPFNIKRSETQSKPDVGLGFSYFNEKFLVSLSVKNLTESSFDFGIDDLKNIEFRNFSFLGKYLIEVDRDLTIEPYLLVRSDFTSHTFDVSALATYQKKMNIGASYRYDEAIVGFLGYHFLKKNKLFVGYSFDYVVHNVNAKAPVSHELVVRYDLPTPQLKKPIRTPRFIY